jgi:hypothetical protein
VALNEWRALLAHLDMLRKERGMHIILLAHAHVKSFRNPEGEDYDRYQLKMHEKGSALLKEWCDAVLFAHQEIFASKKETSGKDNPKMFGVSNNVRVLFTERRPAWDAKNRFGLPTRLPLSWHELMKAIQAKSPEDIDALIAMAKEQIGFIPARFQPDATAALERIGRDPEKLAMLINTIQSQQELNT